MKKLLFLFLVFAAACGGFKGKTNPMSPEEIQIADLAQKLEAAAAQLGDEADAPYKNVLNEFTDRAARFHNACRRFGANSLEARSAFDRLYYQASQVSSNLTKEANPGLFEKWEQLRTGLVLQIAELLGYKPEKSTE